VQSVEGLVRTLSSCAVLTQALSGSAFMCNVVQINGGGLHSMIIYLECNSH